MLHSFRKYIIQHKITVLTIVIISILAVIGFKKYIKRNFMSVQGIYAPHNQKSLFDSRDQILHELDMLKRQNATLFDLITKSSFDSKNYEKVTELCNVQIEDSDDEAQIADGYRCLARINLAQSENNLEAKIHGIKNISHSLNTYNNEESVDILKNLIIGTEQRELYENLSKEELFSVLNFYNTKNIQNTEQEIEILNKIANTGSSELRSKALYRLSYIYQFGRSSQNSTKINRDMSKAAPNRTEAYKFIDLGREKTTIPVMLSFNEKYVKHGATTIASILVNADPSTKYHFYVIQDPNDPILPDSQKVLAEMKYIANYDIEFINFPNETLEEFAFYNESVKAFPPLVWYRLFASKVIDIPKIIYMDVDIIVNRDLSRLLEYNMSDKFFLAAFERTANVPLSMYAATKTCPKNPYHMFYINAGVMVINLDLLKNYNIADSIDIIHKNTDCSRSFLDQDAANFALQDRIGYLSSKWNANPIDLEKNIYRKSPDNIFISHFFKPKKPWNYTVKDDMATPVKKSPMPKSTFLYYMYRNLTPWTVDNQS